MDTILRRRFGVAPEIDMELGTAVLLFPDPARLEPTAFAEALVKSSHRMRAMTIETAGAFDAGGFVVAGTGQRFACTAPSTGPSRARLRVAWPGGAVTVEEAVPER